MERFLKLPNHRSSIFYGWFVVAGCSLVVFGVTGGLFSFGVFLQPMTDDFGWSRASLSLAFGVTFMISGLLRPLAGYLADVYSPKVTALIGVAIMGTTLLLLPLVDNLFQLYSIFIVMSIGITFGTEPILIKIVSQWFYERRGLTLGLVSGSGSFGGMILVPATSTVLVALSWKESYLFLGGVLLILVLPIGAWLIKNHPQDSGLSPFGQLSEDTSKDGTKTSITDQTAKIDTTFKEALRSSFFWKLTFGYFV